MATRSPLVQSVDGSEPLQVGALGQLMDAVSPETQDRNESLAFAGGLLGPGNSMSGALGNAIGAQMAQRNKQQDLQTQYIPLVLQAMGLQQEHQNLMMAFPQGQGGAGTPTGMFAGAPGGAPGGAMPGGMAGLAGGPSSNLGAMSFDQAAMIDAIKPDWHFLDKWKLAQTGQEVKPGSFYKGVNGQITYAGDPTKGVTLDPFGREVPIAGAAEALGTIAGATTGAQEKAKTPFTPMKITVPDGKGGTVEKSITMEQFLQSLQGHGWQPPAATVPSLAPPGMSVPGHVTISPDDQRAHDADAISIIQDELSSNKNLPPDQRAGLQRELARLQIAQAQPGFPTPSTVALGAVDAGPGVQTAPSTTQAAQAAGAKQTAEQAATAGQKYQDTLHDKVEEEYQLIQRNKQILPLLQRYNTGGIAPEERLHIGNMIANSGMLQSVLGETNAKAIGDKLAGGDVTAGKDLENQLGTAAILNMLQALDKEGKPNRFMYQQLATTQEGLKSGNKSLADVFELQKRVYQTHYDEQQALTKAIENGTYDPRTWAGKYSAVRNANLQQPTPALPSMAAVPAAASGWSAAPKASGTVGGWSVVPR